MEIKDLENIPLVSEETLAYMTTFITSEVSSSNDNMDPMMFQGLAVDNDDSTLNMEEFKYMGDEVIFYPNYPPPEPSEICSNDYSGPHSFEVFVDPNGLKSPWEYSSKLNKIYIDIKQKFPINFSVKTRPDQGLLFIRVTPIYEEHKYFQDLVHRCICHEQPHEATNCNVAAHVTQHIIRCDNGSTEYFGDKVAKKRLNLVIPLSNPKTGTDSVKELFYFVCKTSCSGGEGMNRRPIQVIFTLENEFGHILGRRVLRVRVCACPKRDKEKEEQKGYKHPDPKGKKRKLTKKAPPATETADSNSIVQVSYPIVGEKNRKRVLKYARRLMADDIVRVQNSGGNNTEEARFQKCLKEINALLGSE